MDPEEGSRCYWLTPEIANRIESTAWSAAVVDAPQAGRPSSSDETRDAVQVYSVEAIPSPQTTASAEEKHIYEERHPVMRSMQLVNSNACQGFPAIEEKSQLSEESEDEEPETDVDSDGDSVDDWDIPENTETDAVYVVEETHGSIYTDLIEEESPTITIVGKYREVVDANKKAKAHLQTGGFTDVPWMRWEEITGDNGLCQVLAESEHHWYHVQIREEERQRTEPPYVYVVEKEITTYKFIIGQEDLEESEQVFRLGVFRDRRSANAWAREIQARDYEERKEGGYRREKSMVGGLLTITDMNDDDRDAGGSVTVRVIREDLY